MECRKAERLISAFIDDKLETEDMLHFVHHIETCEACLEELSIQYLVKVGMKRLEEGGTFDLKKELRMKLEHSRRKVIRRQRLAKFLYLLEMAAILLVLIITIMVIIK